MQELVTNSVERFADREALGTKKVRKHWGDDKQTIITAITTLVPLLPRLSYCRGFVFTKREHLAFYYCKHTVELPFQSCFAAV